MIRLTFVALLSVLLIPCVADAKECWSLSNMKGQSAVSSEGYAFHADTFSNPMILCFDGTTSSVSGDDTQFTMFGTSPLAGWAQNKGAELFEGYQVDRTTGKVLFTKTRIGSKSLLPGLPDIIGSFVGDAVKMKYVPAGN